MPALSRVAAATMLCMLAAVPVAAQGNGRGHAYGHVNKGAPPSGGVSQLEPGAAPVVHTFGSWLDDASVMTPGSGSLSVSFGWFRSPSFREFDLPVADGGIGITRRVQFGFSVPYYHVNVPGGPVAHGLGDLYLNAKVQLREADPVRHRLGFSVTPVVEVLSSEPGPEARRFNWAIPVSVELQRTRWRAYGSTGYFSRGSLFASAAIETSLTSRTSLTGTITQSHSLADEVPGAPSDVTRTRTDASGSFAYAVRPTLLAFASVGRTLSRQDANAASLVISGGVSVAFDAWRPAGRKRP
jgi:hypothetical protein